MSSKRSYPVAQPYAAPVARDAPPAAASRLAGNTGWLAGAGLVCLAGVVGVSLLVTDDDPEQTPEPAPSAVAQIDPKPVPRPNRIERPPSAPSQVVAEITPQSAPPAPPAQAPRPAVEETPAKIPYPRLPAI